MIAKAIHHISFSVTELERSRQFYEGVLGLQAIPRPDLGPIQGIWYGAGNGEIHLIEAPAGADVGETPDTINPIANHAAFAIEDYAKVRDLLVARGIEVMETNADIGQMWIRDPDGNVIELIQPRGEA